MTDDQLLADFLTHRDGPAFEALVRRHGPMVFRVCRDVLGDLQDAEDAFQATFVVLVRRAASIRQGAALGRWLHEVACRISRRERRRMARIRFQERQVPEMDAAAPPGHDPSDRELKPILHDEIRRLPPKLRDPILLCYFEGLTVEDAARRLDCPIGTLKSRLGKGREVLRSRLARRGLAASALLLLMLSLEEEAGAAVPDALIESTVEVGRPGPKEVGVSRRVARMVLLEEGPKSRAPMVAASGLLLALLVVFGGARFASGRKAHAAAPAMPVAVAPLTEGVPPAAPTTEGEAPAHCSGR